MMKKSCLISVLLLVCIMLFSACTPSGNNSTTGNTSPNDPACLDIYYLADDAGSIHIINSFKSTTADITVNATGFKSVEEMDTRISAEISGNKGPDVILFPGTTSLDTAKMAANQAFLDLSAMLDGDESYDAKNYYSVLDAGLIGGKQLLMPLRFRLQYHTTTQERLTAAGMNLPETYTTSQLMAAFHSHAASTGDDISAMMCTVDASIGALLYDTLRLTGVEIVDPESKTLTVSDDVFLEYAEYARLSLEQIRKAGNLIRTYGGDFTGGLTHITSVYVCDQLPLYMRYYEALFRKGLDEKLQLLYLPNCADPASLTADISLYAAIPKSTDAKQTAFDFVRFAMDSTVGDIGNDLPINRNSVALHLDQLCRDAGKSVKLPTGVVTVPVMSETLRQQCEQTLDRISSGSIRSGVIDDIFTESMEAYITGEADFESCYAKFKNQMNLYLYE